MVTTTLHCSNKRKVRRKHLFKMLEITSWIDKFIPVLNLLIEFNFEIAVIILSLAWKVPVRFLPQPSFKKLFLH